MLDPSSFPRPFLAGVAFIYGMTFGSFANVLALRTLSSESIGGRSHCPKCQHTLNWIDLIPVLGYLLLKGRCRYCAASISPLYPVVELTCGLLWGYFAYRSGWSYEFFLYAPFAFFLVVNTLTDLLEYWVFDKLVLAGIAVALPVHLYSGQTIDAAIGAAVGIAVSGGIYLFGKIYSYFRGIDAYGGGDVTIAAYMGFVLGWQGFLVAYAGGVLMAISVGIAYSLARSLPLLLLSGYGFAGASRCFFEHIRTPFPLVPCFSAASLAVAILM